jgi:hypothetical protein
MTTRDRIATELLRDCPEESRADHERIAEAVRGNWTWEHLRDSRELNRWPETYSWLKAEMETL